MTVAMIIAAVIVVAGLWYRSFRAAQKRRQRQERREDRQRRRIENWEAIEPGD